MSIEYVDTYEKSDALAIASNVDLPIVLEGIKPFRRERGRLAKFTTTDTKRYILVYVKWKDGGTSLGVFNV